jgi:hypothetical protein
VPVCACLCLLSVPLSDASPSFRAPAAWARRKLAPSSIAGSQSLRHGGSPCEAQGTHRRQFSPLFLCSLPQDLPFCMRRSRVWTVSAATWKWNTPPACPSLRTPLHSPHCHPSALPAPHEHTSRNLRPSTRPGIHGLPALRSSAVLIDPLSRLEVRFIEARMRIIGNFAVWPLYNTHRR